MQKKIKTEWNLKLLYKSETDPQIQKDLNKIKSIFESFSKKYSDNKIYLNSEKGLLMALRDYEKLNIPEMFKPHRYFYFLKDIDSNNKLAIQEINRLENLYNELFNSILFFNLDLGKLTLKKQKQFLKSKDLEKYKYYLEKIFENAKYKLSESEEKIFNLMSLPAKGMWKSGFSKVLSNQQIKYKNKEISIYESVSMLASSTKKERIKLDKLAKEKLKDISDFAESEINAVFTTKKISDELRGFEKPYSQAIKDYENKDQTVENLVDVVTKNFKIAHKFYKLKAKILKLDKLNYHDRSANIGKLKQKFKSSDSIKILQSAFEKVDKKYLDILNSFLQNGQIDFLPKKGKLGGAYCAGTYNLPTFVLLNHTDDFNSLNTFAHEMGHAFHSELTNNKQDELYAYYSTAVAETASTLFENFVFEEVFEKLNDQDKIIALHDKIGGSISTIFRQIACFNFEKEAHEIFRQKGYLNKQELSEIMNKNMKKYLGPVFNMQDDDGYCFVAWSHIRRHFYVYSYAFGDLISSALYSEYKKDKKFLSKIEEFLSAGGSMSPEDIFKNIGIDITDPKFFESGLKLIEQDIKKLEKLINKK